MRKYNQKKYTGLLIMLISVALFILTVLAWPARSFMAYYLKIANWGAMFMYILGMLIFLSFFVFGVIILCNKYHKLLKNRPIAIGISLLFIITGFGYFNIIKDYYYQPGYVPLSEYNMAGWEHFNASHWEPKVSNFQLHLNECWGEFPDTVPLSPEVEKEEQLSGYRRLKIRITVENSGRPAWDFMSFYMLIPDTPISNPTPCMIVFHQHDGAFRKGKEEPVGLMRDQRQAFALELVKNGYIAIAPDALCFSERQEISEYKTSNMLKTFGRTLAGKYVWDISCLVDYLLTVSFLNASRIGIMGHSLGGQMAIYCAAYDPRLQLVVSNCGIGKIYGNNSILNYDGEENEAFYLPNLRLGEYPMDMKEIIGLIDKPILLSNGVKDRGLPILGSAEIHNWCEEKYVYYNRSGECITLRHNAGHAIFTATKKVIWDFIRENL